MENKIYVIVRQYEHDETRILIFRDKEQAKAQAIEMAKEDHEYFEFEDNFEDCCVSVNGILIDYPSLIWSYQCENVSIELLEKIIK